MDEREMVRAGLRDPRYWLNVLTTFPTLGMIFWLVFPFFPRHIQVTLAIALPVTVVYCIVKKPWRANVRRIVAARGFQPTEPPSARSVALAGTVWYVITAFVTLALVWGLCSIFESLHIRAAAAIGIGVGAIVGALLCEQLFREVLRRRPRDSDTGE